MTTTTTIVYMLMLIHVHCSRRRRGGKEQLSGVVSVMLPLSFVDFVVVLLFVFCLFFFQFLVLISK